MSSVRVASIVAALLRKGFVEERRDHKYFLFHVDGKKTSVFTFISHGEREANDWLLGQIARQLSLTKREMLRFIECPLSEAEYQDLLIDRGRIKR
jgi:hypothetical protein